MAPWLAEPLAEVASMQPRSEERGEPRGGSGFLFRCDASMQPRSEERGEARRPFIPDATASRFNAAAF